VRRAVITDTGVRGRPWSRISGRGGHDQGDPGAENRTV